ncbi:MAG: acireductone dioxygenase [Nostoc indistinguendum CM1-VF10]|jgi:1,2-dihydroxy-3-keto-5-methylthiopentene dioxygenase|nr:acireductone dioxygenase [Nostoc indistinguendum CM1-VF10]
MAILKLEDGTVYTQLKDIAQELAPLKVQLNRWTLGDNPQLHRLLAKDSLNKEEEQEVLKTLDGYFEQIKETAGYQKRDLVVVHPGIPNLDVLLKEYVKIHTHADDEVRYIIEGESVFGFVRPDGSQVELTVEAEDYINLPAGTIHWGCVTPARRLKAIRYFTSPEGWAANYTGTAIRFRQAALETV